MVVEQTHKKLEEWERNGRGAITRRWLSRPSRKWRRPSFFALLVIAVSFLPVLTLEAQEGRLFKPLAYTKNSGDDRGGVSGHHARSRAAACSLRT